MQAFKLTPRRAKLVISVALLSFLVIFAVQKSFDDNNEFWWRFSSPRTGIRQGELIVVRSAEPARPAHKTLKVVHLDLKGAPPKMSYLRQLLPLLSNAGCDAILLEYEDMFPYHGLLANISAKNAYKQHQVIDLLALIHDLGMEVIPLVQTFGHLEFVLKLEEFRHLRELDAFPQEVCPSNQDSLALVYEMVRQVMALHRTSRYIHIGCDEVFHLGACSRCTRRHVDSREIFAEYVTTVAEHIKSTYPGITPLIWDDMMRQWSPQFLTSTRLGSLVEPVVWVYTDDIGKLVPHYVWHWYMKTFKSVWVAGAYKGATLSTSVLPDVHRHYNNQRAWLDFISKTPERISGFVLTGWSRYDHFAILCELLPPSVPSLLLNLLLITSKKPSKTEQIYKLWKSLMRCSPSSEMTIDTLTTDPRSVGTCSFQGADSYILMGNYLSLKATVDKLHETLTEKNGWMTYYNVKHNFTSPWRLVEDFTTLNGITLLKEVQLFKNETSYILSPYFDMHVVNEWVEQRIEPMEMKLLLLQKQMETLINIESWPRRPLN